MLDSAIHVNAFLLGHLKRLAPDLPEDQLAHPPAPGLNPPLWLLGHLATTYDGGLKLLGKAPACPEAWHKSFGRGSNPAEIARPHPTKAELLAALDRGHAQLAAAAREADATELNRPNPMPLMKGTPLATIGDLITFILTGHFGTHVGQLSFCRRAKGLPHMF
jgi:hypothetical protein